MEKKNAKKKSIFNQSISFGTGVNDLDIALAIRHLSIMLKSAMSISDALKSLGQQTENIKLREIFAEMHEDVEGGMTVAESMKKFPKIFSNIIISVISIGEQGGTLEKNLVFLADFLKKNHELNRKVKGALLYPVIVFGLTTVEMLGVMFFILPKLEALFSSFKNVPSFTKFILSFSKFLQDYLWYIVIGLVAFLVVTRTLLKTQAGIRFTDKVSLKFPVVKKLNRGHVLANFSRTLGILLESGIPLLEGLKITTDTTTNSVYKKIIEEVYDKVKEGESLAKSLERYPQYFPGTYVRIIEVAEATGSLEENLLYLYDFYAEEVEDISNNLATLLEPILLIFIGLAIGVLALTIIGPVYQLTGSINQ